MNKNIYSKNINFSKIIIKENYVKKYLKQILKEDNIFLISDIKLKKVLLDVLPKDNNQILFIKASEKIKSFNVYEKYINILLRKKINRQSTLIAIGGGTIGDLSGFIASTVLRGINFVLIPSTLLSQVDSSIGGKNGINSIYGKNLVGTFYHPSKIIIDTSLLKSLPKRELLCGYAEMIKHAIISDKNYFYWADKNISKILNLDKNIIQTAIIKSIKIKSKIVRNDPNELLDKKISRSLLNFGHSFGHAIETLYGYSNKINHGEAISVGMILEANLSKHLGLLSDKDFNVIKKHFMKANLKTNLKNLNLKKIVKIMKFDKKNIKKKFSIVLLKKIGDSYLEKQLDEKSVLYAFKKF